MEFQIIETGELVSCDAIDENGIDCACDIMGNWGFEYNYPKDEDGIEGDIPLISEEDFQWWSAACGSLEFLTVRNDLDIDWDKYEGEDWYGVEDLECIIEGMWSVAAKTMEDRMADDLTHDSFKEAHDAWESRNDEEPEDRRSLKAVARESLATSRDSGLNVPSHADMSNER